MSCIIYFRNNVFVSFVTETESIITESRFLTETETKSEPAVAVFDFKNWRYMVAVLSENQDAPAHTLPY